MKTDRMEKNRQRQRDRKQKDRQKVREMERQTDGISEKP